jgi:hypothetical protein
LQPSRRTGDRRPITRLLNETKRIANSVARSKKEGTNRNAKEPGNLGTNREDKVPGGMTGHLWIDQRDSQWVRVEAEVVRPVSFFGFFAKVGKGTRFLLEQEPDV